MQRYLLTIVIAMCLGVFWLSSSHAAAQANVKSSDQPLYKNHVYGFRVKLPSGVTYTRTLPPNPDHGFGIKLKAQGKLWADASYTDSSSTKQEAKMQSSGCNVEQRQPIKLDNRPAIALRFSCPAGADGDAYEELLVLTVYREGDRSPVDYQIGMRTSVPETLSQNREFFDKIVAGFRFKR
jgi:hypothetical protein